MPRDRAVFYTTADNPPQVVPALIAKDNADGTVDLFVFFEDDDGEPFRVYCVPAGRGPHSWFDPRQKFSLDDLP